MLNFRIIKLSSVSSPHPISFVGGDKISPNWGVTDGHKKIGLKGLLAMIYSLKFPINQMQN